MRPIFKISAILLFLFLSAFNNCPAQENIPFLGEVNTNAINLRTDSTTSAPLICQVNKGTQLEVILELYDWYKIRLPKEAPSFVKKNLTVVLDEKTVKVAAERVNIRLAPSQSSPILGKANKDQIINILEDKGEWYKIEPIKNSFGWINKKFITKVVIPETQPPASSKTKSTPEIKNKKTRN